MRQRGVLIIGDSIFPCQLIEEVKKMDSDIVVVNNLEAKNIINQVFEPEPIIIYAQPRFVEPVYYENKPNKFIGKPKNNWKK